MRAAKELSISRDRGLQHLRIFSIKFKKLGKEDEGPIFEKPGRGPYYEPDAVAIDIAAGRTESDTMLLAETSRMMKLMDGIRLRGGARFPQDGQ